MGHLLTEFDINAVTRRLSIDGVALTHWWDNQIIEFDTLVYQMTENYGGYVRLGFGRISFTHDLFENDWPPPVNGEVRIKYTESTEALAETFFSATAHLAEITREKISYEVFEPEYDIDILTLATNYDGDSVPLPIAFGTVGHRNPIRLPDAGGGNQRYSMAGIQGAIATCGTGGGDVWCIYDDGINIASNASMVGSNVFELTAAPVGEVTISGIGADTELEEIFDWACGASYLNVTLATPAARAVSPSVNYWASSQMKVVDFLNKISSFFTHIFYIKDTTLYLIDMLLDNGSRTITEFDFFPLTYTYLIPTKQIKSEWEVGEPGEWQDPAGAGAAAVYVKRDDKEYIKESSYPYGNELEIEPVTDVRADIETALTNILTVLHSTRCNVRLPLQGSLPVPGEKISWTDESHKISTDMNIRCRTVKYDFTNEKIIIEGEGTLSATWA